MARLMSLLLLGAVLATCLGQRSQTSTGFFEAAGQAAKQASDATKVFDAVKDSVFSIETDSAKGTGFLFRDKTTVATCYHVIKGAKRIAVKGSLDASWSVTAVKYSEEADIALLTIDRGSSRKVLEASETTPVIGQRVFVIGDALGFLTRTLSEGIVSGLRTLDSIPLVQLTAAISPGVSGAPVLDSSGNVCAIVSSSFSKGQSLNLAIQASQLDPVCRMAPLSVEAFFARSSAAKPVDKPILAIEDAQIKEVARLATQAGRAFNELAEREDASASEMVTASDGFSRYWATVSSRFTNFSAWENIVSCIDRLDISLRQYASATASAESLRAESPPRGSSEAVYEESLRRYREALDVKTKRYRELSSAFSAFDIGLFSRFFADQKFLDALEPTALFCFFGESIWVSREPYGRVIPDYAYPESCVLAAPLLKDGVWETIDKNLSTVFTLSEIIRAAAFVQKGERVFAAQVGNGELTDVRNWRSLHQLIAEARKEQDTKGAERPALRGFLLIGSTREAAKRVPVTFGIL